MKSITLLCVTLILVVCPFSTLGSRPFALHFDIEPASLPEWSSDFQYITNAYLDLLQSISVSKGPLLDLVVDTSNSFNFFDVTRNGITKPLYQWVLDYVDVAMLMCYRNFLQGPSGLLALSQPSVDYATQIGKKVIIGVETNDEDPAFITFFGMNTTYLEYALSQVSLAYKDKSGFGGVAVHDLAGYQKLKDTGISGPCVNKGLFVWLNTVASDASVRASYFPFARSHCVTTTYFESEWLITEDTLSLATFWTLSQSFGMNLHFLYGNAEWAYPYNHGYVQSIVQATSDFVGGLSISIPTALPTLFPPTQKPTVKPTVKPPTPAPTSTPTLAPTAVPTSAPTHAPTPVPTPTPTLAPTAVPTSAPTPSPTPVPTRPPTAAPSPTPSPSATHAPTTPVAPSATPRPRPTFPPTFPSSIGGSPPPPPPHSASSSMYANLMVALYAIVFVVLML